MLTRRNAASGNEIAMALEGGVLDAEGRRGGCGRVGWAKRVGEWESPKVFSYSRIDPLILNKLPLLRDCRYYGLTDVSLVPEAK